MMQLPANKTKRALVFSFIVGDRNQESLPGFVVSQTKYPWTGTVILEGLRRNSTFTQSTVGYSFLNGCSLSRTAFSQYPSWLLSFSWGCAYMLTSAQDCGMSRHGVFCCLTIHLSAAYSKTGYTCWKETDPHIGAQSDWLAGFFSAFREQGF